VAAIGILGGTFDPVHNAHLAMAQAALRHLRLGEVRFVPTGPTRYRTPAIAPAEDRVAMLRLALAGEPRFSIDEREMRAGASGYTVDTLKALRAELGEAELFLLMGADQFEKLATWHRPEEVKRLARIAVFVRPGIDLKEDVKLVPMKPMDVSASKVRALAKDGKDLAALVPPVVANYIRVRRLYA
jgi:nicotinate-nucleotide adenylyltransferase